MEYIDWIISTTIFLMVFTFAILYIPYALPVVQDTQMIVATESLYDNLIRNTKTHSVYFEENIFKPKPFVFFSDVNYFEDDDFVKQRDNKVYGVASEKLQIYDKNISRKKIKIFEETFETERYKDFFTYSSSPEPQRKNNYLDINESGWIQTDTNYLFHDTEISFQSKDINFFFNYVDGNNYFKISVQNNDLNFFVVDEGLETNEFSNIIENESWKMINFVVDKNNFYIIYDDANEMISHTYEKEGFIKIISNEDETKINRVSVYKQADLVDDDNIISGEYFEFDVSETEPEIEVNFKKINKSLTFEFLNQTGLTIDKNKKPFYFVKNNDNNLSSVFFPATQEFWMYSSKDKNISVDISNFTYYGFEDNMIILDDEESNFVSLSFFKKNTQEENECEIIGIYDGILPITDQLVLHLDATTIEGKEDGDRIEIWQDLSENNYHFTEADTQKQPFYKQDGLNALPVVEFKESEWLRNSDISSGSPSTIFIVWRIDEESTEVWPYAFDSYTSSPRTYLAHNNSSIFTTFSTQISYTKPKPFDFIINSIVSGSSGELYEDGTLKNSGDTGTAQISGLTLGGRYSEPRLYGDISEIIIYDKALTNEERQQVEQYLGEKWFNWQKEDPIIITNCEEDLMIKTRVHYNKDISEILSTPKYFITKEQRQFVFNDDLEEIYSNYDTNKMYAKITNNHIYLEFGNKRRKPTYTRYVNFITNKGILEKVKLMLDVYR